MVRVAGRGSIGAGRQRQARLQPHTDTAAALRALDATPPEPERPPSRARPYWWIALAALVLGCAAVAFPLLDEDRPVSRVLFFGGGGDELVRESRLLPRRSGRAEQVRLLVDEVILGPRVREHAAALPRSTTVRALTLGSDTAYLDLSAAALLDELPGGLEDADRLRALASTLLFNTPWLQQVWLFVDGQIPDYPAARGGWERPCC